MYVHTHVYFPPVNYMTLENAFKPRRLLVCFKKCMLISFFNQLPIRLTNSPLRQRKEKSVLITLI